MGLVDLDASSVGTATDWIEAVVLANPLVRFSDSRVEKLLRQYGQGMDDDDVNDLQSDIRREMERRRTASGDNYPFARDGRVLAPAPIPNELRQIYALLVLCSLEPDLRSTKGHQSAVKDFERLTALGLGNWISGEGFVFTEDEQGDEIRFKKGLARIGELLGVIVWPDRARPRSFDHGCDVAAWRSFDDSRLGFPIYICQCTTENGRRLIDKAREVQASEWCHFAELKKEGRVVPSLAVPHVLDADYRYWGDLEMNTVLVIDRTRLTRMLSGADLARFDITSAEAAIEVSLARYVIPGEDA